MVRPSTTLPGIQYFFSASMLKMTNELLKSYNFPLGIDSSFFFGVSRISFGFVAIYFLNNDKRCVNMQVLCRVLRGALCLMYSFIFIFCKQTHTHTHTHTLPIRLQYYRLWYILLYTAHNLLEIEFGTTRHALKRRAAAHNILHCVYIHAVNKARKRNDQIIITTYIPDAIGVG